MTQCQIVRKAFSTVIACAMLSVAVPRADPVERSGLFGQLWGFGGSTTGGLGGDIYVVNRTDDSGVEGTLRYGVEAFGQALST